MYVVVLWQPRLADVVLLRVLLGRPQPSSHRPPGVRALPPQPGEQG
jgi:hypothetical protein